jgi:hypothetical protein
MEWLFVCYSLQMGNLMVEVMISLIILCGGSHEGSLLYSWVFVGGFHSIWTCWSSPHSLVTILGRMWCYGVVVYDLNHLWVVAYHSPLGRGLVLCYWSLHSWLWWLLCQGVCFRVGFYYLSSAFISALFSFCFWENHEGYALHVLSVNYWPARNLYSSVHNLSYLV